MHKAVLDIVKLDGLVCCNKVLLYQRENATWDRRPWNDSTLVCKSLWSRQRSECSLQKMLRLYKYWRLSVGNHINSPYSMIQYAQFHSPKKLKAFGEWAMRTFHLDVSLHRHSLLELMSYQITDFPLNLDALPFW